MARTPTIVLHGTGAPSGTPSQIGLIYINDSNGDIYISNGTSSSSNWKKVTVS